MSTRGNKSKKQATNLKPQEEAHTDEIASDRLATVAEENGVVAAVPKENGVVAAVPKECGESVQKMFKQTMEYYKEVGEAVEENLCKLLKEHEKTAEALKTKIGDITTKAGTANASAENAVTEQLMSLKDQLRQKSEEAEELEKECTQLNEKNKELAAELEAAQEKYSKEVQQHSTDLEDFGKFKEELSVAAKIINNLVVERNKAEASDGKNTRDVIKNMDPDKFQLEKQNSRIKKLENQNRKLKSQVHILRSNVPLDSNIRKIAEEGRKKAVEEALATSAKAEIPLRKQEVQHKMEQQLQDLKEKNDNLRKENDSLKKEMSEKEKNLQKNVVFLADKNRKLEDENRILAEEIKNLKSQQERETQAGEGKSDSEPEINCGIEFRNIKERQAEDVESCVQANVIQRQVEKQLGEGADEKLFIDPATTTIKPMGGAAPSTSKSSYGQQSATVTANSGRDYTAFETIFPIPLPATTAPVYPTSHSPSISQTQSSNRIIKKKYSGDEFENEFSGDEPEELQGSDDDWTPAAEDGGRRMSWRLNSKKKSRLAELNSSKDEDDFDSEEEKQKKREKPSTTKKGKGKPSKVAVTTVSTSKVMPKPATDNIVSCEHTPATGVAANAIPEKEFRSGAFIVLKTDFAGDGDPPIWKIEKTLLHKYIPFQQDGKTLYKNTTTYSGWSIDDKDLYYPAPVVVKVQNRKETIVEFLRDNMKSAQVLVAPQQEVVPVAETPEAAESVAVQPTPMSSTPDTEAGCIDDSIAVPQLLLRRMEQQNSDSDTQAGVKRRRDTDRDGMTRLLRNDKFLQQTKRVRRARGIFPTVTSQGGLKVEIQEDNGEAADHTKRVRRARGIFPTVTSQGALKVEIQEDGGEAADHDNNSSSI